MPLAAEAGGLRFTVTASYFLAGVIQSGSQNVHHFFPRFSSHLSRAGSESGRSEKSSDVDWGTVPQSNSCDFSDLPLSLPALERCEDTNFHRTGTHIGSTTAGPKGAPKVSFTSALAAASAVPSTKSQKYLDIQGCEN